jgi:hypothetical protein
MRAFVGKTISLSIYFCETKREYGSLFFLFSLALSSGREETAGPGKEGEGEGERERDRERERERERDRERERETEREREREREGEGERETERERERERENESSNRAAAHMRRKLLANSSPHFAVSTFWRNGQLRNENSRNRVAGDGRDKTDTTRLS